MMENATLAEPIDVAESIQCNQRIFFFAQGGTIPSLTVEVYVE
jgi:hypothetical protein